MATEVNRLLNQMQSGQYIPTDEEKEMLEQTVKSGSALTPAPPVDDSEETEDIVPKGPSLQDFRLRRGDSMMNESIGYQAAAAGYGDSRYDRTEFIPGEDVEHKRAVEQSNFWKVANGAIKGGVYAATTAVETVAGVIDGVLEGTYEFTRQLAEGDKIDVGKIVGAGVNNAVAKTMHDIQTMSDEWFPNYRTEEERSPEYQQNWQRHIFSANFIGDSFLKNFGFTVGAVAGGAVWSKALNGVLRSAAANQLMKGVTAAAEGSPEAKAALEKSLDLINKYAARTVDEETIRKNISGAAKALNKMNEKQKLFGAVIGAMGEGTMEGVMAREEFLDNYRNNLDRKYIDDSQNLRQQLINDMKGNSEYVTYGLGVDSTGRKIPVPTLTAKGEQLLADKQKELADNYFKNRNMAEDQADRIAATTFVFNLPILTISNTVQFGRMFSGGWKTARNNISKVAGGLERQGAKLVANYEAAGNVAGKAIGKALKVGTSEASEEMLQGFVSSGARRVADARLTSFNDDGYDRKVMKGFGFWAKNMLEGGGEYLGDWQNWQEGFMGMLTGLIGMPGRGYFAGQRGGLAQAISEARSEVNASAEAANALNNRINSEKFQRTWQGYVRHMKYDAEMEDAVAADDQYTWQIANDKQLVNDIMMFADAGRLNELKETVDFYASMSDEQLDSSGAIEAATSSTNAAQAGNNPASVAGNIREQAQNIKDTIDMYNSMYDALSARAPLGTTPGQLRELVWTSMGIRKFENRFLKMFDEVIDGIDKKGYAKSLSETSKTGEAITDEKQKEARLKEVYSALAEVFTGTELPVDTPVIDALDKIALSSEVEEKIKETNDEELKKKFDDMKKVSEDRKAYLKKLLTLQNLSPEKFEQQAESPEEVAQELREEAAQQETSEFSTLNDVRNAWASKNAAQKADFMEMLRSMQNPSQAVSDFLKLYSRDESYRSYFERQKLHVDDDLANVRMVFNIVQSFLRRAKNENDYINLPDTMFPSYDEFARDNTTIAGIVPPVSTLSAIKKALRDQMSKYLAAENVTRSAETINPTTTETEEKPGTVSTPDGYDASQPGSVEQIVKPGVIPDWVEITDAEEEEETAEEPAPESEEAKSKNEVSSDPEEEKAIEEATVSTASTPTEEELFDDAVDAAHEDASVEEAAEEKVSVGRKQMIPYYRTSAPEISTGEASDVRFAIKNGDRDMYKNADLSDFLVYLQHQVDVAQKKYDNASSSDKKQAEEELKKAKKLLKDWEPTENALKDRGAFDTVAEELKVGDEIEFVVDPSFPEYNGQYQILMTVMKNGERKVLNLLSIQTSQYLGLADLRHDIQEEYLEFRRNNPGSLFVFSKKSKVWLKRKGLIDYDFNEDSDKGIINTPRYNSNAPIAYINSNGQAVVVRGSDKSVVNKVSDTFNDPQSNRDNEKRGNLYYLTDAGNGWMIPIRLGVEHFKESTKDIDNPTFEKIRQAANRIAQIVSESDSENYKDKHAEMLGAVKNLMTVLDVHDVEFNIGNFKDVGVAFRMFSNTNPAVPDVMRRPDQMSADWLINYLAKLDRPVQLKEKKVGTELSLDSKVLDEYIEQGLITSNARMMRPKGVDFYIDPYIDGTFKKATEAQIEAGNQAEQEKEQLNQNPEPLKENVPESDPVDMEDDPFADFNEFSGEDLADVTPGEVTGSVQSQKKELNHSEIAQKILQEVVTGKEDKLILFRPGEFSSMLTDVVSHGSDSVNKFIRAMQWLGTSDASMRGNVQAFDSVLNNIFSQDVTQRIEKELSKRFKVSSTSKLPVSEIFEDYNSRAAQPLAQKNGEDIDYIKSLYYSIEKVFSDYSAIQEMLPAAMKLIGVNDLTASENGFQKLGGSPDISVYSNLNEKAKEHVKNKGYSEEEYNELAPELQDKIVDCVPL